MNLLAIILVFSFCSPVFAETYKYVAYADKFPATTEKVAISRSKKKAGQTSLQDYGYTKRAQPSEETQYVVVKNTDIVVIEVTFKNNGEKKIFDKMEDEGRLFLYEISGVVTENGLRKVRPSFRAPIPVDLNKDWSVKRSSP